MRDGDPVVSIKGVVCKRETEKALLCIIGDAEHWIAKSHVHDDSEVYGEDHEGTLVISEWLATQKGLV